MASYTWKGVSGDWNLASDWTPASGPPTASDTATINGSATTTITVDTADVASSLTLSDANATLNDDGSSASLTIGGTLAMSNGTLNISDAEFGAGGVLTVGALNLSGGALTIDLDGQLYLGGTLNQTGGTLTLDGGTISGGTIKSTAGTLVFDGGGLSGVTSSGRSTWRRPTHRLFCPMERPWSARPAPGPARSMSPVQTPFSTSPASRPSPTRR